jgi:hypothetical protein
MNKIDRAFFYQRFLLNWPYLEPIFKLFEMFVLFGIFVICDSSTNLLALWELKCDFQVAIWLTMLDDFFVISKRYFSVKNVLRCYRAKISP